MLVGAWDILDREVDGQTVKFGTVDYDRAFLQQLDDATRLLGASGAKVVVLTTPFFSRPELVGPSGGAWPEYEPWRVDRVNSLYRDFLAQNPGRYTLIDLNRFVSPEGKFADSINGVKVRGDGVHFTEDGSVMVDQWLVPQLEAVLSGVAPAESELDQPDSRGSGRSSDRSASRPARDREQARRRGLDLVGDEEVRLVEARADAGAGGSERLVDDRKHPLVPPHVPAAGNLVPEIQGIESQELLAARSALREVGVELRRAFQPLHGDLVEEQRQQRLELRALEQRDVERVLEIRGTVRRDHECGAVVGGDAATARRRAARVRRSAR